MSASSRPRYPGAQPFTDDVLSRKLFFGREQESVALAHQILANRLTVLFARSGLGKTSLLNAGVAEKLRSEGFLPLSVRVNDTDAGPLESLYRGIASAAAQPGIEYVAGGKASLWHFFKATQFWSQDILLTPVLVLDQFEELFTLHSEKQRSAFLDQFSNLVRGVRPESGEPGGSSTGDSNPAFSDAPPAVKIVVSLREDFLAHLEEISDRIPEILDQRFRLLPLARDAAAQALEAPARIEDADLVTRPFEIEPEARRIILGFLERRVSASARQSSNPVEPFQLQLICQHVEEIARGLQDHKEHERATVTMAHLGGERGLRKILEEFYKRQVAAVSSLFQRKGVRRLCSEFLISPQGRRLRMEESEIQRLTGVKPPTLQTLVDRRLVRREQSAEGNYYELSHDSLVGPVLDTRRTWFLMRAVWAGVLTLIGLLLALSFGVSTAGVAVAAIAELGGLLELTLAMAGVAVLALIVWMVARWGVRNFREFREMWHRSRI
jgi:hypothetical protein